jgi:lambda repressor-like predicted transcriptional regulator
MNHTTPSPKSSTAIIQARMVERGLLVVDLARIAGVKPSLVSNVIHGRRRSLGVEKTIVASLDLNPETLWPSATRRKRWLSFSTTLSNNLISLPTLTIGSNSHCRKSSGAPQNPPSANPHTLATPLGAN